MTQNLINTKISRNNSCFGQLYINIINGEIKNIKIRRKNKNIILPKLSNNYKNYQNQLFMGYTDKILYQLNENNKNIQNDKNGLYMFPFIFDSKLKNEIVCFKPTDYNRVGHLNHDYIWSRQIPYEIPINYKINKQNKLEYLNKTNIRLILFGLELTTNEDKIKSHILILKEDKHLVMIDLNENYKHKIIRQGTNLTNFLRVTYIHTMYNITKIYYGIYFDSDVDVPIKFPNIVTHENAIQLWKQKINTLFKNKIILNKNLKYKNYTFINKHPSNIMKDIDKYKKKEYKFIGESWADIMEKS